jgi:hypothetical protein
MAISPWTNQYSVTRMDAHSEIFILFFSSSHVDFFPFRYRHTKKRNAGDKRPYLSNAGITSVMPWDVGCLTRENSQECQGFFAQCQALFVDFSYF